MKLVILFTALAIVLLTLHSTASTLLAQQPVTITTDSQNYYPGDQVFVNVTVLQPGGVNADAIWVFVNQPNNVSNYFQMLPPTGGQVNFTLAMDAPYGNYTLVAEWNYPAGLYVRTWFTVTNLPVPEFPYTIVAIFIAFPAVLSVLYWKAPAAKRMILYPAAKLKRLLNDNPEEDQDQ